MKEIKIMSYSKKIILTGATGLIGKEVIKPLKDLGFDIYALTIDKFNPDCGITWIPCNIFDENSLKDIFEKIKPEYLLNFAWCTTEDYLTSNLNFEFLKAGMNLLKFFKMNGGKRVVFPGTCFEYAFQDKPLKETDIIFPKTTYAKCKNHLRELAELYCVNNDISFGWGRIFYVYGHKENEKRLTAYIINNLKQNNEVVIKNGNLMRDYMYSKDIAYCFAKFLDSNITGAVNICTGKSITLADYASIIAEKLNKDKLVIIKNEETSQPANIIGDNTKLMSIIQTDLIFDIKRRINDYIREEI